MRRTSWALLAGLLLLLPGAARAADEGPAGNWKLSLFVEGKMQFLWLVQVESADGKLKAKILDKTQGAPKATLSGAKVDDGVLRFNLAIGDAPFQFEAQMPKGAAKVITGNVARAAGRALPAELERTGLKVIDQFYLDKEALAKATGFEVATTAVSLLQQAAEHKAKVEEVRSWADKAYKAAEPYGARVQADITLEIAQALTQQEGYADEAVKFARLAKKSLDLKAGSDRVAGALEVLASALKLAGKTDEAKDVETQLAKLTDVAPKPYAGRKAKSDRVVLVELFTGAQCPPCYAADKAFDALDKTYKPGEVVLLEYHAHIPGPDPLTIAAGETRFQYYFSEEGGTPSCLFDGKQAAEGGGGRYAGLKKYDEFVAAINPLLEAPAKAALKVSAARKGNKIDITAEASDVAGDNVRLRLALVEDAVDYKGTNGIPSYRHVVRAMPGGAEGFAVKDKTAKHSASIDLDEVKKDIKKYLDDFKKKNTVKFPGKEPEVELKGLRVVAFLQNDKTKEVLQAAQVEVKGEK